MKFHWKVLAWMLAGVVLGLVVQRTLEAPAWAGASWTEVEGGLKIAGVDAGGPVDRSKLAPGDVVVAVVRDKGRESEERWPVRTAADFEAVLARSANGDVLRVETAAGGESFLTLGMAPGSARARVIKPFDFVGQLFMALLKMLIVPLVLSSIITGVAGLGDLRDLRRLGGKTFTYYVATSLLAIVVGQVLVSVIRPGDGAELGLTQLDEGAAPDVSFVEVILRMVPENVVAAMTDNGAMLSIIFFALMFGFFITRTKNPHRERMTGFFEGVFQVMLKMAEGVLSLLPYGVFCLMVRVVAKTGFGVFEPLLLYMATVTLALVIHSAVTLPLIVRFFGRMSPLRWFKAMSPAIMTAFSTSSSSMTLPVTLETVEKRGHVSNKITSFTLPLGATINMDGTALYECIGVIFLAQYYAGTSGFELSLAALGALQVE